MSNLYITLTLFVASLKKGKKETPIHYEITLKTAEKKKMEVIVSLDGKSVKTEAEAKAAEAKKEKK